MVTNRLCFLANLHLRLGPPLTQISTLRFILTVLVVDRFNGFILCSRADSLHFLSHVIPMSDCHYIGSRFRHTDLHINVLFTDGWYYSTTKEALYLSLAKMASCLSFSFSSCCCWMRASRCLRRSCMSCSLALRSASRARRRSSTAASLACFSSYFLWRSSCRGQRATVRSELSQDCS